MLAANSWLSADPVGAQAIRPCNNALNNHLRADEIAPNVLAFNDPDVISFRGQYHPAPATAKQS
jgi:hypothetical protein